MADWLSVTERGVAQPIVYRYVGGFSKIALSAAFGTNISAEGANAHNPLNCCLQTDSDRLWAVLFDGLYRSIDGGATFTSVFAFTSPAASTDLRIGHGGIHFVYDPGTQETYLAGWFKSSVTNTMVGWSYRLSDGATAEVLGPSNASFILGAEILYGTTIHVLHGLASNAVLYSFDPTTATWATYSSGFSHYAISSFAIGPDGVLYLSVFTTSPSTIRLLKFTGAWSAAAVIEATPGVISTNGETRLALFSDGTDLFSIHFINNVSYGWRCSRIPSPFDGTGMTDITSGVLTTDLIATGDGGSASASLTKRCHLVQDTETSPGTLLTYLAFSEDSAPSTPFSIHQWQGPATLITFVGSGGAVRDSMHHSTRNGGAYFYTPTQDGVRIVSVTPVPGGESIAFIASGGGTVDVQFRRSVAQQGAVALATLTGTATGGGTRVGNQVQGVTADGTTVNTVTWDFFTDSILNGTNLTVLVPETV